VNLTLTPAGHLIMTPLPDTVGSADAAYTVPSLKAGGSGLNLTAASHVIHFDRWWRLIWKRRGYECVRCEVF